MCHLIVMMMPQLWPSERCLCIKLCCVYWMAFVSAWPGWAMAAGHGADGMSHTLRGVYDVMHRDCMKWSSAHSSTRHDATRRNDKFVTECHANVLAGGETLSSTVGASPLEAFNQMNRCARLPASESCWLPCAHNTSGGRRRFLDRHFCSSRSGDCKKADSNSKTKKVAVATTTT